ncbi:hypothetical protein DTO164E3_6143 [Paecilomyces variotii]|nr:hypothetical protein DTO032I3_8891 [Paecilomyces variotii]KAJ9196613.1 hypothetical protein DTO164E3_6143 [Paecilomyces variotii]KAJ9232800.1 hypothetical protein DTO169E5_7360 [Paecilomyces variotii]KAJ9248564.1 hypothetical protein DTO207G8_7343 [Paecilomyces variotii]KAJ9268611.1 hypothetical protein DTO212C5_5386 [Paecilomyces variotii]
MSELAFCKSFLSALDTRPVKLPADYVFDPQTVGLRVPYTLPRLPPPHPSMPKKIRPTIAPGSSKSIRVHLKSARNPVLQFSLDQTPVSTTTVEDLKRAVQERVVSDTQTGAKVPLDKIKVLYKRKPVTGKTIAEVLADEPDVLTGGREVEFGVMIMGGATVIDEQSPTQTNQKENEPPTGPIQPKPAVGPSGEEVLKTEAFWDDLQGFLAQRIKDEKEAARLRQVFHTAWAGTQ